MKRFVLSVVIMLLIIASACPAFAEFPALPHDMLPLQSYEFMPDKQYSVYCGPGKEYGVAANGKAKVSTNGDIQLFGDENGYALIQYAINENKCRIGYINMSDEDFFIYPSLDSNWVYGRARAKEDLSMTDDPFLGQNETHRFHAGTEFITLFPMEEWTFVEVPSVSPVRGFVPTNQLETVPVPYENNPCLAGAVDFLKAAGLDFEVTGLYFNYQDHLYITPKNGGKIYYLGFNDDFYPYDLRSWYIEEALSDEDAGKLIDHFLNLAATVKQGLAPEEHLQYGYRDTLGEQNIDAVVSNILLSIESEFGDQGFHILCDRLSLHDGNDILNSLRAQAASRILGKLDNSSVSPSEGCAWYDALALSVQDDLPRNSPDYIENDLMRAATRLLLAYNEENNPWHGTLDVDAAKTVNIVDLKSAKVTKSDSTAIIWGVEWYSKYALYDSSRAANVSGHVCPLKLVMQKNAQNEWILKSVTYAQDGTMYAPSILAFCNDNQTLANRLMALPGDGTWDEFLLYLDANGFDADLVMPIENVVY